MTKAVKKSAIKKTTKAVTKTDNLKKFLIRFKSYSFDNFYMLTTNNKLVDQKTGKLKITADKFCKTYIPYEYEGWNGRKFKYELFEACPVCGDELPEEKMLDNSRYIQYNEQVTELLKNAYK